MDTSHHPTADHMINGKHVKRPRNLVTDVAFNPACSRPVEWNETGVRLNGHGKQIASLCLKAALGQTAVRYHTTAKGCVYVQTNEHGKYKTATKLWSTALFTYYNLEATNERWPHEIFRNTNRKSLISVRALCEQ